MPDAAPRTAAPSPRGPALLAAPVPPFDPFAAWRDRLSHAAPPGLTIAPAPPMALVTVQGNGDLAAFQDAVLLGLGCPDPKGGLPGPLGCALLDPAGEGDRALLWLGPERWLVMLPRAEGAARRAALEQALAPLDPAFGAVVTDTSDDLVALDLVEAEEGGTAIRALLARGCALDLSPPAFPPGSCARTLLADLPVVIAHLPPRGGGASVWMRLCVAPSLARSLAWWLVDALAESHLCRDHARAAR